MFNEIMLLLSAFNQLLRSLLNNCHFCCPSCSQEFTMHDTIGCYLDVDKGQISFSKNGIVSKYDFFYFFIIVVKNQVFVMSRGDGRFQHYSGFLSLFFSIRQWPGCGVWHPSTCEESAYLCSLCAKGTASVLKTNWQVPISQVCLKHFLFSLCV